MDNLISESESRQPQQQNSNYTEEHSVGKLDPFLTLGG
eukprot:CAMPEP_0185040118 /NCGR_PEP_ID=MMETSP1103-20130426/37813_1 /TAXON_ID=36769 /ORGANISM="Paraphysomonas bandaiensis, Strain Caron Lab Isolate" /LENGTH=37 /DNA_ID= /DNA_START= /DNA_END= /DNA_ORIENTATION=